MRQEGGILACIDVAAAPGFQVRWTINLSSFLICARLALESRLEKPHQSLWLV